MEKTNKITPLIFGSQLNIEMAEVEEPGFNELVFEKYDGPTKMVEAPNPCTPIINFLNAERESVEEEGGDKDQLEAINDQWAMSNNLSISMAISSNGYIIFRNGFLAYLAQYLDAEAIMLAELTYHSCLSSIDVADMEIDYNRLDPENYRTIICRLTSSIAREFADFYAVLIHDIITHNRLDLAEFVDNVVVSEDIMSKKEAGDISPEQRISFAYSLLNEIASNDMAQIVDMIRIIYGRYCAVREQCKVQSNII